MTRLTKVLALCVLLPIGMAGAASAEPAFELDFKTVSDAACKDDVKKFCPDVEKGKKSACLKEHSKNLTSECKAARMALDFLKSVAK